MNYDLHIAKYNGTWIKAYGGECVANAAQYCVDNGKPIAYANAKDWANHSALQGAFMWIANNANDINQVPTRGDIIVWAGGLPGSGGYGHIAIWDRLVSPGVFSSLDQNWGGMYVHFVNHNWSYVLGWWTPKTTQPSGGGQLMDNDDKIKRQYRTLRGNEGTPGERAGWLNKPYDQFNQTALPEIESRERARIESQVQIANLTRINNELSVLLSDTTATTKAQLQAKQNIIAGLQTELTTAMDRLKEAQDTAQTPLPETPDVSAFKSIVAFIKKLLSIKE